MTSDTDSCASADAATNRLRLVVVVIVVCRRRRRLLLLLLRVDRRSLRLHLGLGRVPAHIPKLWTRRGRGGCVVLLLHIGLLLLLLQMNIVGLLLQRCVVEWLLWLVLQCHVLYIPRGTL